MSEPDEYYDESYLNELRDNFTDEIIDEFVSGRLTSEFDKNPSIAEPAHNALVEAKALLANSHFSSAQIHAVIAIEVAIKRAIVEPVITGYIHNPKIAPLLTASVMMGKKGKFSGMKEMFQQLLRDSASIDFEHHKRTGATELFHKEIENAQGKRNKILHEGQLATREEAEFAIALASEILEVVFPRFAHAMGYHIHDGFKLCGKFFCSPKSKELKEKLDKAGVEIDA